jgi:hypothetical protein
MSEKVIHLSAKPVQKPSVGRIVLVPMDPGTNNGAEVAPAIVTQVWSDDLINVRVFANNTSTEWRTSSRESIRCRIWWRTTRNPAHMCGAGHREHDVPPLTRHSHPGPGVGPVRH